MKTILGEWDRHGYVVDYLEYAVLKKHPWRLSWKPTRVSHSRYIGSYPSEAEAKAAAVEHRKERNNGD